MNVRTQPSQRAGSETPTASRPGLSAWQVALRGGMVLDSLGGTVLVGCLPPATLTLTAWLSGARRKGELGRGYLSGKYLVSFEQDCHFSKQYFYL